MQYSTALLTSCLLSALVLGTPRAARADHSIADILPDNPAIAQAITQVTRFNQVVCDLANSNQSYYYRSEQGQSTGGTAWKQIALCFENTETMNKAHQYFVKGGQFGFYGAPGVVGILVVAYTWENYTAATLIELEYH